jgi:glycosyltransferase involved in cell wall biosynthesis
VARPLRILQLIETGGPGGAETVYATVSAGLRDRGHTVHCLVAPGSWLPDEMRRRGLPPEPLVGNGAFDVAMIRRLARLMRGERIDVVHAHLFDGAVYASLAARLAGVPCVATLHGQVDIKRGGWRGTVKRQLFRHTVSALVVVSRALGRDLAPLLPLPASRVHVIPNGVARREAASSRCTTGAREENAPPRLIAIGNIRRPKNYPLLLDALHRLRRQLPDVQLDIVGEPDREGLYDALLAQVAALELSEAVTFHGFVADPSALLARAQLFVLSSSQEGFSLATIEAMLAGIPVVATRSGGPEEILRDGETGVLVPSGDAEALAGALGALLTDRALAGRLATAAEADAAVQYGLDTMLDRYEALYRHLAKG